MKTPSLTFESAKSFYGITHHGMTIAHGLSHGLEDVCSAFSGKPFKRFLLPWSMEFMNPQAHELIHGLRPWVEGVASCHTR